MLVYSLCFENWCVQHGRERSHLGRSKVDGKVGCNLLTRCPCSGQAVKSAGKSVFPNALEWDLKRKTTWSEPVSIKTT